jgi:hypothetical protein
LAALLPLGLWAWCVVRPVLLGRSPPMWIGMTRLAIGVLVLAGAAAGFWLMRSG